MSAEEIAALAAQYNESESNDQQIQLQQPPAAEETNQEQERETLEASDETPGKTPGYLSYEEYVAAGKDPKFYKGEEVYKQEYGRIQEVKELKGTVKSMEATLRETVNATTKWQEEQDAKHKAELEKALAQAREDEDIDAALEAQRELARIQNKPKPQAQQPQTHPVLSEFLSSNAALADNDIHGEFARIYNGRLRADGVAPDQQLSDAAIKAYAKSAMESVKQLYPERFQSPRNSRIVPPKPRQQAPAKTDYVARLKGVKLSGVGIDERNANAALGIYNMLKKNNPDNPRIAENYAKSVLGE